jgi:hypothetical protein
MNHLSSSWAESTTGLPTFVPVSAAGPQISHSNGAYPYMVIGTLGADEHTNTHVTMPTATEWKQDNEDEELKRQRHKHKLVEQSRREKTRALTSQLQSLVGLQDLEKANMNAVLEGVLDYLRNTPIISNDRPKENVGQPEGSSTSLRPARHSTDPAGLATGIRIPSGIFHRAFDTAPVGVAMTSVDGQIIWYNKMFQNTFVAGKGMSSAAPSMFSLTAPEDLPRTMQVSCRT